MRPCRQKLRMLIEITRSQPFMINNDYKWQIFRFYFILFFKKLKLTSQDQFRSGFNFWKIIALTNKTGICLNRKHKSKHRKKDEVKRDAIFYGSPRWVTQPPSGSTITGRGPEKNQKAEYFIMLEGVELYRKYSQATWLIWFKHSIPLSNNWYP